MLTCKNIRGFEIKKEDNLCLSIFDCLNKNDQLIALFCNVVTLTIGFSIAFSYDFLNVLFII